MQHHIPLSRIRAKDRLIACLVILIAFLAAYVISKFYDNTYYYLYPQFTYEYTWIVLVSTLLIGGGLILIYKNKRAKLKRNLFVYTLFVFLVLFNTACFIGAWQYLIYLSDKNSFKVDDDVKNYELNIESSTLEKIKKKLLTDRSVCLVGINALKSEKIIISEKNYSSLFSKRSNIVTSFQLQTKDVQFEMKRIWNQMSEDPRKPDTTHTQAYGYYLEVQNNNHSISILQKDEFAKAMAKYFENPFVLNRKLLISAIMEYISELDNNISILEKNKLLIEKRGVPLSQFTYDSLMKSLQQDAQIFKMLSLKSKAVHILHLIIISLILIPFILDLAEKWRNRL
ncbi:hypothetical protein DBR43_03745 [Pedobacter sp. KBW06]|uniref:hypothetical protein n=1 Tax=Pedobacter sp. KBW06 TaxID=2153359 RepID=UPI000F5A874B|nr:hypothetical protein [Pedobacter sp. KBW06]RQO74514.1 hypothetical protein DBR43_03745 [Pedobacter sp. KBW06]